MEDSSKDKREDTSTGEESTVRPLDCAPAAWRRRLLVVVIEDEVEDGFAREGCAGRLLGPASVEHGMLSLCGCRLVASKPEPRCCAKGWVGVPVDAAEPIESVVR